MKSVVIIGFGRFGALLASLLKTDFSVSVSEVDHAKQAAAQSAGYSTVSLSEIGRFDWVIFAVPISQLEATVEQAAQHMAEGQLAMDVCSVKVHPARVMQKHLSHCQIIATHPMFGPDSASKGLKGLQVAICPISASAENVEILTGFWSALGIVPIENTPEEHDKDAAYTLAFTHSIAKIILGVNKHEVTLTTRSHDAIREVARLSAKDSQQLFHDMLYYNPYFKDMKEELISSMEATKNRLDEIEREQENSAIFVVESASSAAAI